MVVAKKVEKYLTKMVAWNLESGSLWPLARALWSFRIAAVVTLMGITGENQAAQKALVESWG